MSHWTTSEVTDGGSGGPTTPVGHGVKSQYFSRIRFGQNNTSCQERVSNDEEEWQTQF